MRQFLAATLLPLAVGCTSPAMAQIVDGWSWSVLTPSIGKTDQLGMALEDLKRQDQASARTRRRAPDLAVSRGMATPDMAALRYMPSKERRAANLAKFVQKTRAADPQGATDLQKLFAEGDFIERIGGLVAPIGLHIDNVADAYALWWITAWQATHGKNDDPKPAILAAVRAQAAAAVTATGEMARASDAQKQELAEALWVQTVLIDGAVEQAKHDPARLRQVGDAVRQGARGMGLNLDTIELTSKGFVPTGVSRNDAPAKALRPTGTAPYSVLTLAAGGMGVGGFLLTRRRRG